MAVTAHPAANISIDSRRVNTTSTTYYGVKKNAAKVLGQFAIRVALAYGYYYGILRNTWPAKRKLEKRI